MNTGSPKDTGLGAPAAALLVALLVVVAVFAYASLSSKQVTSTSSPVATTSTTQASTSHPSSTETFSTLSASSATSSSTTISRIADTQSSYPAAVSGSATARTGTNTTASNCPPHGGAPMELQVVSDATGVPVQQGAAAVSALYQTGCVGNGFDFTDTLYFYSVSEGSSGWFDLPSILGAFNFTVGYAGHTYSFPAVSAPVSTTCVTLSVPSGAVSLIRYQYSNYDCTGNLGQWAANATYTCFGEVYLRVLSYSDLTPVPGATVNTSYDFNNSDACNLSPYPGSPASKNFTTTNTEWYAFGDAAKSFSVMYGGLTYNVTQSKRAGSTCVTLLVPSGAVDTTYGPSCSSSNSLAATPAGWSFSIPVTTPGNYTYYSDINSSNICHYSSATATSIISNIEDYPAFKTLEGNQTYTLDGYGCETAPAQFPSVSFRGYYDAADPMQVKCPNGLMLTYYPTYWIEVDLNVTSTGYDLTHSTYTLHIESTPPSCPAG